MSVTIGTSFPFVSVERAATAKIVDELLRKIDALAKVSERLFKTAGDKEKTDLVGAIKTRFEATKQKIPIKDNTVTSGEWIKLPEAERKDIAAELSAIFENLKWLNRGELGLGKRWCVVFSAMLVALCVVYLWMHTRGGHAGADPKKVGQLARDFGAIESMVGHLIKANAASGNQQPSAADMEKARAAVGKFRETAVNMGLSVPTLKLLGRLESDLVGSGISDGTNLAELSKIVPAELESERSFLWSSQHGPWIEIAWWAEIGTLVGIIFYIALSISDGRFLREEVPMFWVEVIISPIAVLSIFFLFSFTGVTGVTLEQTSLTGVVGFAFVFGFAIRRTLGLFDTIKKRLMPDPSA